MQRKPYAVHCSAVMAGQGMCRHWKHTTPCVMSQACLTLIVMCVREVRSIDHDVSHGPVAHMVLELLQPTKGPLQRQCIPCVGVLNELQS